MQHILAELDQILRTGKSACYTALVETRGSTPQKSGAAMIVYPDGSQVGTLGGGCVEAEVKRRALHLLDAGHPELLTFQLDSDYGWDDGLICGGRMKMLVDPIRPGDDLGYYRMLIDAFLGDRACTEAVIIDPEKSGGHAADRYLFDAEAHLLALRGSSTPPDSVQTNLRPLSERPRPYVAEGVSYLPHLKRCRLIIVGAGHVGQKTAELAAAVDFDVWVIDDREEYCNAERFPAAKRLIVGPIDQVLSGLEIDPDTYCLIVTRGHNHDEEALYYLAETPARYVGLIGSRRKIKMIFEDLLQERIAPEALRQVHAPLGFDIGSQTVPEIAISIVAELVAHRNLGAVPEKLRAKSLMDEMEAKEERVRRGEG
jgi:xanthine dehydrogenase accessory factor